MSKSLGRKLNYTILDVFTFTRYLGNPLAIVHVPEDLSRELTQEQKQLIAREFNLSETVFLHELSKDSSLDSPFVIDIFTTEEELPFAGHPTVGTSWYLLSSLTSSGGRTSATLKTKAGDISAIQEDGQRVLLRVPVDFKEHAPFNISTFKSAQPNLRAEDFVHGLDGAEAVASIVKGMSFVFLGMRSEDALARLRAVNERFKIPYLGDWQGLVGLYAFYEREDGVVRTRMMLGALEDPATGSAASALGGWLGSKKGPGKWKIDIVQGVEMGRRSDIEVRVEVLGNGEIAKIELGGNAVEVMEGTLIL